MVNEEAKYAANYDKGLRDYIDENLNDAATDIIIGLEKNLNDTHEELFGNNKNGNKNN